MFLKEAFADARAASLRPHDFFGRRPEAESWSAPTARMAFWAFLAGLLDSAVIALGLSDRPGGVLLNLLTPFLFPVLTLAAGLIATLTLHLLWKVLGGTAPLAASWRTAAAISFTMPLDVLMGDLGPFSVMPALLRYWLLGCAGQGVHGLSRGKAWSVAVTLAFLHVLSAALS